MPKSNVPPSTTYLNDVEVAARIMSSARPIFSRVVFSCVSRLVVLSLSHVFQHVLSWVRIFSQVTQQTLKCTSTILGMVVFWGIKSLGAKLWAKLKFGETAYFTWNITLHTQGKLGGVVPPRTTGAC
jgi:hypothetical protein